MLWQREKKEKRKIVGILRFIFTFEKEINLERYFTSTARFENVTICSAPPNIQREKGKRKYKENT